MGDSRDVAENVARLVMRWMEGKYLLKARHLDEELREQVENDLAEVIHKEIRDFI